MNLDLNMPDIAEQGTDAEGTCGTCRDQNDAIPRTNCERVGVLRISRDLDLACGGTISFEYRLPFLRGRMSMCMRQTTLQDDTDDGAFCATSYHSLSGVRSM